MRAWLERFQGMVVAAGAAIVVLLMAYLRGRGAGRSAEREERANRINGQAERARQEGKHVQEQTARMDDAAIAAELKRDWVRGARKSGR
ncbi:MAG: hypothetical protein ACREX5_13070 [Achromobacter pestifer]